VSGGVSLDELKLVSFDFFNRMTKGHLQDGDVLINKDGAQTGKVGYFHSLSLPASINEHLFLLRGKSDQITQKYLYYTLLSQRGQNQIKSQISGSAQPGIKSSFLKGIVTDLPQSISEQAKISEILSTVDRAIEQTEALIAKQQRIKSGLMQDLLTRGIDEHGNLRSEQTHKFKDSPLGRIPVQWEVAPLLAFASKSPSSFVNGPFGSDLLSSELQNEGVPVIYIRGSSLKSMGKVFCNMIEIRNQEMQEVDTDRDERHGSFSVGFGFATAMASCVVRV